MLIRASAALALAALLACGGGGAAPKAPPPKPPEPAAPPLSPEAKRVRSEQCAALIEKARAKGSVQVLAQMQRPVAEGSETSAYDAARKVAQATCERVRDRLPKDVLARAQVGCDVAMISIPADEALQRTLCADQEIYMLGEEIPLSPAGGGH